MSRRGQAALEFLTTYGWALLVILAMIAAISYFGVMNPSKLLPSKCIVGPELNCMDYQIKSDGQVSLQMKQGVGKTIYLQSVTCSYEGGTPVVAVTGAPEWNPKDARSFTCNMGATTFAGLSGQKVKVQFELVYKQSQTGFDHLVEGEVYSGVQ